MTNRAGINNTSGIQLLLLNSQFPVLSNSSFKAIYSVFGSCEMLEATCKGKHLVRYRGEVRGERREARGERREARGERGEETGDRGEGYSLREGVEGLSEMIIFTADHNQYY